MLASASDDKTVKLLDFKTGKTIHTGKTADGSKLLHFHFLELNFYIDPAYVRLFHLDHYETSKSRRKFDKPKSFFKEPLPLLTEKSKRN